MDNAGGVSTSGSPVDNDFAKFTDSSTIEGRSYAEVKEDLNLEIGTDVQAWDAQLDTLAGFTAAQVTRGIVDDNLMTVDDADAADNDYAKFTASGLEGRSYSEVKSDLSLSNVENTALSTWAGTTNITTVGGITVTDGTFKGTTTFQDADANPYLTMQEGGTGLNDALISGASNAGLYLATDSGTRIELTGNQIIQTGRVTSSMTAANMGSMNTASAGDSFYEVEAIADESQVGPTRTTTLTLPDGQVGGERYTVACIAAGGDKAGLTLTGTCIISGTLVNGTGGLPATSMTGATAAGMGTVQPALYEFIWVPGTVSGMGGWMYTSKVYT